jgi:hypothetical protein
VFDHGSPDLIYRTIGKPAIGVSGLRVTDFLQEEEIDVVAQARDGREAPAKIETTRPDVAIVDLQMPAEVVGARLRIESAPGAGIHVEFWIPDTPVSVDEDARPDEPAA